MFLLDTNVCIQLWQRDCDKVRRRFLAHRPSEIRLCSTNNTREFGRITGLRVTDWETA